MLVPRRVTHQPFRQPKGTHNFSGGWRFFQPKKKVWTENENGLHLQVPKYSEFGFLQWYRLLVMSSIFLKRRVPNSNNLSAGSFPVYLGEWHDSINLQFSPMKFNTSPLKKMMGLEDDPFFPFGAPKGLLSGAKLLLNFRSVPRLPSKRPAKDTSSCGNPRGADRCDESMS